MNNLVTNNDHVICKDCYDAWLDDFNGYENTESVDMIIEGESNEPCELC